MRHGVTHYDPDNCFGCKVKTVQLPAFSGPVFQPHFNYSVGKYVNSDREFRDELKRCSDSNSDITGTEHNFEPRYPGDVSPIREADQVLDDRAKNIRAIERNEPLPVTAT